MNKNMQKKSGGVLILPYYGNLPTTFSAFLKTCRYNSDIDFLLFTDDRRDYDYPANFNVVYNTFTDLRQLIQSKFDFTIALESPKKLCDFKPTYGYIFEEYTMGYEFWGHCDCDLLFGKISTFINTEKLKAYDLIFSLGHLTFYRNCEKMNMLFKTEYKKQDAVFRNYRDIFQTPQNIAFDEWLSADKVTIRALALQENIKVFYERYNFDAVPYRSCFIDAESYFDGLSLRWETGIYNAIFVWDKGILLSFWMDKGVLHSKPVIYAHFQKRKFDLRGYCASKDRFMITPNRIYSIPENENLENLVRKVLVKSKIRTLLRSDEITKRMHDFINLWLYRVKKYILKNNND